MTSEPTIVLELRDGVGQVVLNRPTRLNAFNEQMSSELVDAMQSLASAPDLRVVVIRGAEGNFMGGADIGMLQAWSQLSVDELRQRLTQGFSPTLLERLPVPVIAAVDGFALGMGCEVALACDLRIATDRAVFGLPEITLGLIPGAGGSQRLPRVIGPTRAAQAVLTGGRIESADALAWGLVNRVVPPGELDAALDELVGRLRALSPVALQRAKQSLLTSRREPLDAGIEHEMNLFVAEVLTEDATEGTAAFLEKRRPAFVGR